MTRETALADDLAQITFLKAFENQKAIRDEKAVKSWLFQIAYRSFVDHVRKEKRRRDLAEQQDEPEPMAGNPSLALDIERAMDLLLPECRAVVMLGLAHGHSHGEIADITGIPLGTVKSHMNRGKQKLRAFLSEYETVD